MSVVEETFLSASNLTLTSIDACSYAVVYETHELYFRPLSALLGYLRQESRETVRVRIVLAGSRR